MQELIESIVRFSAAMTMFGMQQFQNALESAVDSQSALKKLKESLDSVSKAITAQLDESKKPAVDSVSNLADRAFTAMNVQALDPRQMMQTTGDLLRKTTDSLADMMKKTSANPEKPSSDQPQPAAKALRSN